MAKIKRIRKCLCGCGKLCSKPGNLFISGHNLVQKAKYNKPKIKNKTCLCGCGALITSEAVWMPGHYLRGIKGYRVIKKRPCECGCGKLAKPGKRFIHTHASKVVSDETKAKLSKASSGKGHWAYGMKRENNPNYGKHRTEEAKIAIGAASSNRNSGKGNPNWQGGISYQPYCKGWNSIKFKKSIFERDNYECQNPWCEGKSDRRVRHHIDGIKENCCCLNIITLCNSCSIIVEGRRKGGHPREWWNNVLKQIATENEIKYDFLQ